MEFGVTEDEIGFKVEEDNLDINVDKSEEGSIDIKV